MGQHEVLSKKGFRSVHQWLESRKQNDARLKLCFTVEDYGNYWPLSTRFKINTLLNMELAWRSFSNVCRTSANGTQNQQLWVHRWCRWSSSAPWRRFLLRVIGQESPPLKTVWSCFLWTCRLRPTWLKWERARRDWQLWRSHKLLGSSFSSNVEELITDLALAGSPRWTECNFVPVEEGPRSSWLSPCCSTSRAASRSPPPPASTRPCLLQRATHWVFILRLTSFLGQLRISAHLENLAEAPRQPYRPRPLWSQVKCPKCPALSERCCKRKAYPEVKVIRRVESCCGDSLRREPVDHVGVSDQNQVQPAAPPPPTRCHAKLSPPGLEQLPNVLQSKRGGGVSSSPKTMNEVYSFK